MAWGFQIGCRQSLNNRFVPPELIAHINIRDLIVDQSITHNRKIIRNKTALPTLEVLEEPSKPLGPGIAFFQCIAADVDQKRCVCTGLIPDKSPVLSKVQVLKLSWSKLTLHLKECSSWQVLGFRIR